MSGVVIAGDGNGRIWRRNGPNNWAVAYDINAGFLHRITALSAWFPANDKFVGIDSASGSVSTLTSVDDGATLAVGGSPPSGSSTNHFGIDDDGNFYAMDSKSTDGGGTWTAILPATAYGTQAANGYLWYWDKTSFYLHRANLDGSGDTELTSLGTITPSGTAFAKKAVISTFPCSNRLFVFSERFDGTTLWSVDVTDPLVPTIGSSSLYNGDTIIFATPITNQVGVAHSVGSTAGSAQQTTDGGGSWSLRASDARIGGAFLSGAGTFSPVGVNTMAVDPGNLNNVYLVGAALTTVFNYTMYAAYSTDQGSSWTIETVTTDYLQGATWPSYNDGRWFSIAVSGTPPCLRRGFPGVGRWSDGTTRDWFTRA